MDGRGGGRGGRGRSQWGSRDASEDAAPRLLSSLRLQSSRLPRLPGDEGRGGAQPGARRGRRCEVRAAGVGGLCGGRRGRARARPVEAAPPLRPRPGVWLRARARACVPAVRAGRDAEVKFGRGREIRQREGARVAAITEPRAAAGAGEGGRDGAAAGGGEGGRAGYPAAGAVGLKVSGRVCWGARDAALGERAGEERRAESGGGGGGGGGSAPQECRCRRHRRGRCR